MLSWIWVLFFGCGKFVEGDGGEFGIEICYLVYVLLFINLLFVVFLLFKFCLFLFGFFVFLVVEQDWVDYFEFGQ